MATAFINGKRVNIPDSGMYGRDINNIAKAPAGRRTVISKGGYFETVKPDQHYSQSDLIGKNGKVTHMPDRSKGGSFDGNRSHISKTIIIEQVYDIASKLFRDGVDYDDVNGDWMVVPNFKLPNWHHIAKTTPLLVRFPDNYPEEPPIGFYMKANIPESANGHLYNQAYYDAGEIPTT